MDKTKARKMYWKLTGSTPNYTYLIEAIIRNDLELIKILFDLGLDPNGINDEGNSPLIMILLMSRNIEVLKYILNIGADPNMIDNNGNIPFAIAVARSPIEFIELLLSNDDLIVTDRLLDESYRYAKKRKDKRILDIVKELDELELAKKRLNISKPSTNIDTNISDLPADILESISKNLSTIQKTKKGGKYSNKKKRSKTKNSKKKGGKHSGKKRNSKTKKRRRNKTK